MSGSARGVRRCPFGYSISLIDFTIKAEALRTRMTYNLPERSALQHTERCYSPVSLRLGTYKEHAPHETSGARQVHRKGNKEHIAPLLTQMLFQKGDSLMPDCARATEESGNLSARGAPDRTPGTRWRRRPIGGTRASVGAAQATGGEHRVRRPGGEEAVPGPGLQ